MTALNIVLTGATGGIGQSIAKQLAEAGHHLTLVARNPAALAALQASLPGEHSIAAVDLQSEAELSRFCVELVEGQGVDVLINNAGLSSFGDFLNQQADLEALMAVNLMAPIRLCKALLPTLKASPQPSIINIGSSFGSIGYPGFSLYCATKFGLRGFTEALQRELSDGPVAVHYLAPRAVNTEMNSAAVVAMNNELGNRMDEPDVVAEAVLKLLDRRTSQRQYLGWPEKFFVRLNALLPAVVGKALAKQLPVIRRYSQLQESR